MRALHPSKSWWYLNVIVTPEPTSELINVVNGELLSLEKGGTPLLYEAKRLRTMLRSMYSAWTLMRTLLPRCSTVFRETPKMRFFLFSNATTSHG